jgi:CDP-glycerol glycerophosphotransferase (TagB/SpsB family)
LDICRAVPAHWNLMVKPHPNLVPAIQSDGGGLDALAAIEEYLAQRPNAAWLPVDPDLLRAMCAADLMVTDYSSAAEEYLVFDRPLVFADHLAHASGRDRAHRNQGDWEGIFACGAVVTELGAMGETVRHSLEHPDEHSAARRALRDYVFAHLDGRCAERAAEAIRQVSSEQ